MTEEKFFKYLEANLSDYSMPFENLIVTIKMYNEVRHTYHYENVLLLVNTELGFPYYEWETDWWKGQDYSIEGFIPVSGVLTYPYTGRNINLIMEACHYIQEAMRRERNEDNK